MFWVPFFHIASWTPLFGYPTWLLQVVCLWFCEPCGYTMRPYLVKRLRRLGFLCVWNTSTSWYLLKCIDVLSRYAWIVPLIDKTGKNLKEAFEVIFKLGRQPIRLQIDRGTELRLENLRLVGLCKVYVSWDCNHSLTSFFVYPFGLNLLRPP
jgi:hypothetical protein